MIRRALSRRRLRPRQAPPWELFRLWPLEVRRSWLRHPAHLPRCDCGDWCVVYAPVIEDRGREPMWHSKEICQPEREVVE